MQKFRGGHALVLHSCLHSLDCFDLGRWEGRRFPGEGVEAGEGWYIQR